MNWDITEEKGKDNQGKAESQWDDSAEDDLDVLTDGGLEIITGNSDQWTGFNQDPNGLAGDTAEPTPGTLEHEHTG